MTGLKEESEKLIKEQKVSFYTSSRERALSSFRELSCPLCKKDLEDGELVIEIECAAKHNYHSECLTNFLKDRESKGITDSFDCAECGETVKIVGD